MGWLGVIASSALPEELSIKIGAAVRKVASRAAFNERLRRVGLTPDDQPQQRPIERRTEGGVGPQRGRGQAIQRQAELGACAMQVRQITPSIGAEISGVDLGQASRDEGLYKEIRAQLLEHKVLFLRDQDITRAEHVAFARRFGDLEDHPVAGSDPEHPGLVLIHRSDTKESLREQLSLRRHVAPESGHGRGAALHRVPARWRRHACGSTWCRPTRTCPKTSSS